MQNEGFVRGTLTLTITGFINRIIGFLYNVYLIRLVGTEAVGLYRMVTPLYITLLVIAGAGIPYAISKLVAENRAQANYGEILRIVRISLYLLLGLSTVMTILLIISAPVLSRRVFADPRTYSIMLFVAPGLMIVAISSVFRGYFQGMQLMTYLGTSQVAEQLTHCIVTISLATFLSSWGTVYVAVGVALGMIAGELVGLVILAVLFQRSKKELLRNIGRVEYLPLPVLLRRMFSLAIPVTIGRIIASLSSTINTILIPARLQAGGVPMKLATAQFGQLTGVALPLLFFPNLLNLAMSINLVPSTSASKARRDNRAIRRRVEKSLLVTYLTGLPISVFLILFAAPLTRLTYNVPEAGPVLAIASFGALFAYLRQTTAGVLNGLGHPSLPVRNYIISLTADSITVYFLAAHPSLLIKGAAVGSLVNFLCGGLLNLYDVHRLVGLYFNPYYVVVVPLLGTAAAAFLSGSLYQFALSSGLLELFSLIVACLAGLLIYGVILFIGGVIHYSLKG